jgi:hypothetical protein
MATPRRLYAKLPLGVIDDAIARGASPSAALLLALMLTSRAKRSIPGLLPFGPSGLAESCTGLTPTAVKRALSELHRLDVVALDATTRPPLIFVVGAVKADPPATENAVRGMSIQFTETPSSPVRNRVHAEITASLKDSAWLARWHEWTASHPESVPESGSGLGTESGPLRSRFRDPISDTDPAAELKSTKSTSADANASPAMPHKETATSAMLDRLFHEIWETEGNTSDRTEAVKVLLAQRSMAADSNEIIKSERRVAFLRRVVTGNAVQRSGFTRVGAQ